MLTRRGFLQTLATAAAAVAAYDVIDPERLLWVPGQKAIFLPPVNRLVELAPIVAPAEYRATTPNGWDEAHDGVIDRYVDLQADIEEGAYLRRLDEGATFVGRQGVFVVGPDGTRPITSITADQLDAMRGRLLKADAQRARRPDWQRRHLKEA